MIPNKYRIIEGPTGVYSVQIYNGSNIGWAWVKDFTSREQAERWILQGIIKREKPFGDGSFKSYRSS